MNPTIKMFRHQLKKEHGILIKYSEQSYYGELLKSIIHIIHDELNQYAHLDEHEFFEIPSSFLLPILLTDGIRTMSVMELRASIQAHLNVKQLIAS